MSEMTSSSTVSTRVFAPTLANMWTIEQVAYVGIAVVAFVVRFLNLDLHPLAPNEAHHALAAWLQVQGESVGALTQISPLLLSLNRLLFLVAGGSDALARVWPVLAGSALCLLPYSLRHQLGRGAALISAILLALSPTLVLYARTADGTMLAAFGLLVLLICAERALTRGDGLCATVAGLALGFTLSAASSGYTGAIAVVIGLVVFARRVISADAGGLAHLFKRAALPALFAWLFGSTFLLFFWPGVGAAADLLGQWVAHLTPSADAAPLAWPLLQLALYEPLSLLGGLVFLAFCLRNVAFRSSVHWLTKTLVLWAGLALVLALAGRQPADSVQFVLPLTLLAGQGLARLLSNFQAARGGNEEWVVLGALSALSVTFFMYLASWTRTTSGDPALLLGAGVLLGLIILLVVLSMFWLGRRTALLTTGVFIALVMSMTQIAHTWTLNHDENTRPFALAYEIQTAPDVRVLVETLRDRSAQRLGDPQRAHVNIVQSDVSDLVRWYTRDFDRTQLVTTAVVSDDTNALITPQTDKPTAPAPGFVGAPFVITTRWTPDGLSSSAFARWLLYQESTTKPTETGAILWLDYREKQ